MHAVLEDADSLVRRSQILTISDHGRHEWLLPRQNKARWGQMLGQGYKPHGHWSFEAWFCRRHSLMQEPFRWSRAFCIFALCVSDWKFQGTERRRIVRWETIPHCPTACRSAQFCADWKRQWPTMPATSRYLGQKQEHRGAPQIRTPQGRQADTGDFFPGRTFSFI